MKYVSGLLANIRIGWKKLVRDKRTNLVQNFVNYGQKRLVTLGPGGRNCQLIYPNGTVRIINNAGKQLS